MIAEEEIVVGGYYKMGQNVCLVKEISRQKGEGKDRVYFSTFDLQGKERCAGAMANYFKSYFAHWAEKRVQPKRVYPRAILTRKLIP